MALTPLYKYMQYDHHDGAFLHFRVRMDVHCKHGECTLADLDVANTKIEVEQIGVQWKLLYTSEVSTEREKEEKQGCPNNVWDKWVCHGNAVLEFGTPLPYFNPFSMSGGVTWIVLGKTRVRLVLTLYPDGSTKELVLVDGRPVTP